MKIIITVVTGGLIVGAAYHFLGEGTALAIIGGWIFCNNSHVQDYI